MQRLIDILGLKQGNYFQLVRKFNFVNFPNFR